MVKFYLASEILYISSVKATGSLTKKHYCGGTMSKLMNMSAQEIVLLSTFAELAKEALEAARLIREHYSTGFGIGNREIEVYQTESCGEYYGHGYLNVDGVFRYTDNWGNGREYSFNCDADGIYRMLRSCYLREHDLQDMEAEPFECQIEHIADYFREFVAGLRSDKNSNVNGKAPIG